MNKYLLIAFFATTFAACSGKPGVDIDPRDQYLGEYNVIFKATGTTASGMPVTINQAGTMTVVEGLEVNQIAFVEDKKFITAILSGSSFTLVPIVSPLDKDFVTTGSGSFGKNSFTLKTIGKGGTDPSTEVTMTGTRK